jgi:hypothetical protein
MSKSYRYDDDLRQEYSKPEYNLDDEDFTEDTDEEGEDSDGETQRTR